MVGWFSVLRLLQLFLFTVAEEALLLLYVRMGYRAQLLLLLLLLLMLMLSVWLLMLLLNFKPLHICMGHRTRLFWLLLQQQLLLLLWGIVRALNRTLQAIALAF